MFVCKNSITLFAILIFLSGCSVFSPVKLDTVETYDLSAVPNVSFHSTRHPTTLLVPQPSSSVIYNTTEMLYTTKPFQLGYFVKSSWVATPAQMLQPAIAHTLQNTGRFRVINGNIYSGNYDYILDTRLI